MTIEIIDKNCFFKRAYCNVKVKMSTFTKYTPHGIKILGIQTQEKYVFKYNYEVQWNVTIQEFGIFLTVTGPKN